MGLSRKNVNSQGGNVLKLLKRAMREHDGENCSRFRAQPPGRTTGPAVDRHARLRNTASSMDVTVDRNAHRVHVCRARWAVNGTRFSQDSGGNATC